MKENDVIWVSIEESDKYELSNYGFVRNKYTKKEKSFTYIKNNKYKAYCIDGIQYLAHRLVAKYFVINNNPEKYNIVNHIDENIYNNAYWNLEWCTNKENLLHSDVFNRISKKQSKYKVYQYDKDGNIIKIWDSKEQVYKAGLQVLNLHYKVLIDILMAIFGLKKMNLLIKIDMLQLNKLAFIIEILISYCLQALLENVLNFWV